MRNLTSSLLPIMGGISILCAAACAFLRWPRPAPPDSPPTTWDLSSWDLHTGESPDRLITGVAGAAGAYGHINVSGSGELANLLATELLSRYGPVRVTQSLSKPSGVDQVSSGAPDLLIRVTSDTPGANASGEYTLTPVEDAHLLAETVRSGLWALRSTQGLLKDPRAAADPVFRRAVNSMHTYLGDWTSSSSRGVLDRGDALLKALDWILAGTKDLHDVRTEPPGSSAEIAGFVLLKSETFAQAIEWVSGDFSKKLFKWLGSDTASEVFEHLAQGNPVALKAAVGGGISSAVELVLGLRERIASGHFTIDELEHYLDAFVAATTMAAVMILTDGNYGVAKNVSDFVVNFAKAARWATQQPIQWLYDRFDTSEAEQAFELWQAETVLDARNGNPPVTWEQWAKANGFRTGLSPELTKLANDTFAAAKLIANQMGGKGAGLVHGRKASPNALPLLPTTSHKHSVGNRSGAAPPPAPAPNVGGVLLEGQARPIGHGAAALRDAVRASRVRDADSLTVPIEHGKGVRE